MIDRRSLPDNIDGLAAGIGPQIAPAHAGAGVEEDKDPFGSSRLWIGLDGPLDERASKAHWYLEKALSDSAKARGYNPQDNNQIDMHFETPTAVVLAEMKSCHRRNLRSQVRRGILWQTVRLVSMGVVIGAAASAVLSRLIAALLFETAPTDPAAFVGTVILLAGAALVAAIIPARRASRVDPMKALRPI